MIELYQKWPKELKNDGRTNKNILIILNISSDLKGLK